jgi:uncharacterized protein YndB with AHSA1/START domain
VFRAFSDPKLARRWGPDGCRVVSFEADMRVGGAFRQTMTCGGKRLIAHGVYRKIVPGKEVVFTHQWEEERPVPTRVTVSFHPVKGSTEIVLRQTGFRQASEAAGHERGWASALARFARIVAAQMKRVPRASARTS